MKALLYEIFTAEIIMHLSKMFIMVNIWFGDNKIFSLYLQ